LLGPAQDLVDVDGGAARLVRETSAIKNHQDCQVDPPGRRHGPQVAPGDGRQLSSTPFVSSARAGAKSVVPRRLNCIRRCAVLAPAANSVSGGATLPLPETAAQHRPPKLLRVESAVTLVGEPAVEVQPRRAHRSKRYTAQVSVFLSVHSAGARVAFSTRPESMLELRLLVCQTFDPNVRLYQHWAGSNEGTYDNEKDYRPCSYRALPCRVRGGR
jgi:hypothetical protein